MSGLLLLLLLRVVPAAAVAPEAVASQPAEVWARIVSPSADPDWGPEDNKLAAEWLRQLSDPDFGKREEATARLKGMGVGVFGLLAVEYRASRDLEKRLRIREIAADLYLRVRLPWFDEGFLGIQMQAWEHGVYIIRVLPGTAAAAAGLKARDIVVEIDGQAIPLIRELDGNPIPPVADTRALRDAISSRKAGDTVRLQVIRRGRPVHIDAVLGRRNPEYLQDPQRRMDFHQANAEFDRLWEEVFDKPSADSPADNAGPQP